MPSTSIRWRAVSRSFGWASPSGPGILPSAISTVDARDRTWVEKSTGPSAGACSAMAVKIYPDAAEDGHPDENRDIVSLVDTLRDLYPPLDPAGEREGGLVTNTAPGGPTTQAAPGVLTAPP